MSKTFLEALTSVGKNLQSGVDQLKETKANKEEKASKPFKLKSAWNIINSGTLESLHPLTDASGSALQALNTFVSAGITECAVTVNIQPSYAERTAYEAGTKEFGELTFRMFPDTTVLKNYLDTATSKGIKVFNIKFHSKWLRDLTGVDVETKMDAYCNAVNREIANIDYVFDYISVVNESPALLSYSGLLTFLSGLKQYGKVLLSGIESSNLTDDMVEVVDGYCPHYYVSVGKMGQDTDIDFAVERMKESSMYNSIVNWKRRSTKPIIIGEGGCLSYWNALYLPESWNQTDTLVETGEPQIIYISALCRALQIPQIESFTYWWDFTGNAIDYVNKYNTEGRI